MFCQKCGAQLEDTAKFCDKCGNAVNGVVAPNVAKEKLPDTEVLLRVKPTFKFLYYTLGSIISCGVIFLFFLMLALIAGEIYLSLISLPFCLLIMIITLIQAFFKKAQLRNMNYEFYRTKIEYSDSFLNKAEKEVKYKHIRETVLSRRIFDRIFGLGAVILYTNAESGFGNGIVIPCLENSEAVYKEIKELLEANNG